MQKEMSFTSRTLLVLFTWLGVLFTIACGQPQSHAESDTLITQHPVSTGPTEPKEVANNELQPYIAQLADHRLFEFSRYNSGSRGDGMRSEAWADLCSNGSYFTYKSSTISIGGDITQDIKEEQGTWKVYNKAGSIMLYFKSDAGLVVEVPVTLDGSNLFLNGKRFYHIPKGEEHGPRSCN